MPSIFILSYFLNPAFLEQFFLSEEKATTDKRDQSNNNFELPMGLILKWSVLTNAAYLKILAMVKIIVSFVEMFM